MGGKRTEACGRCSVTAVLDATEDEDGGTADDGATDGGRNPFDGERIELSEREVTSVVRHEVAMGKLKRTLDEFATRLTYGN